MIFHAETAFGIHEPKICGIMESETVARAHSFRARETYEDDDENKKHLVRAFHDKNVKEEDEAKEQQ